MTVSIVLFIVASYLAGSIPTGLILAKFFHKQDIRQAGSGNIGATNVTRVLGKKLGIITFAGDVLKGFLPVCVGAWIFSSMWATAVFGFATFLGHLFPVYLGFRGGKGVATAFGVLLYVAPLILPIEIILFAAVVALWRCVSLGSLTAAASMPVVLLIFSFPSSTVLLSIAMAFLIFFKHTSNIKRLLNGTENRIY